MFRLLAALGIEADFFAGHSYGEYAALAAAGALAEDDLIRLSHRRGQCHPRCRGTTRARRDDRRRRLRRKRSSRV